MRAAPPTLARARERRYGGHPGVPMSRETSHQAFADHVADTLDDEGFRAFQPMICLPDDGRILVIDDIPATVSHTDALRTVLDDPRFAGQRVQFAVRAGPDRVDVGERRPNGELRWLSVLPDDDGDLVVAVGGPEAYAWFHGEDDGSDDTAAAGGAEDADSPPDGLKPSP